MCARKPMWVSLIYCTLPCAMMWCPQRLGGSGCHCRMISPAGMALSSKLAAAACEWCDGQTDRHPTSLIDPALHTTLAVQIIHMLSVLWSACQLDNNSEPCKNGWNLSRRQHLQNALFDALRQLSGTHYRKLFSVVTLLQFLSLDKRHSSFRRLSLLSLLTNTLPGPSASKVTTLWCYTNLFIIIIIK